MQVLLTNTKGSMGFLSSGSGWLVICVSWGFAVAFSVYATGWSSGAHINPAVTLGMAAIGYIPWSWVPIMCLGQVIGAFLGSIAAYLSYMNHWALTEDLTLKLCTFCTFPQVRNWKNNFLAEFWGTFMLLFGVLFIIDPHNGAGPLAPFLIGMLVMTIGLSIGGSTGWAINPARDLGPRIAHAILPIPGGKRDSDWGYAWIPIVATSVGGIVGALVYMWIWPLFGAAVPLPL